MIGTFNVKIYKNDYYNDDIITTKWFSICKGK